jgi:hypothetical protein
VHAVSLNTKPCVEVGGIIPKENPMKAMNKTALKADSTVPDADEGKRTKTPSTEKGSGRVIEYAERISENWQNSIACILKVATDCAAAKNNFPLSEKRELIERLPFGESMFSKLASIGEDSRLYEHQEFLPPSISTLHLIRRLSDEQFQAAKAEKILRTDVTRDKFQKWTLEKADKPARIRSSEPEFPLALYCVYPEELLVAEQHIHVRSAVVEMAENQGLKVAIFTGENLIAELKAFFSKKAETS